MGKLRQRTEDKDAQGQSALEVAMVLGQERVKKKITAARLQPPPQCHPPSLWLLQKPTNPQILAACCIQSLGLGPRGN